MSYRYCCNHDVLCGKYDCNMADVVNNSVMCESKECMYNGGDYAKRNLIGMTKEEMCKLHSGAVYGKTVMDLVVNNLTIPVDWDPNLSDEDYPF